MKVIRLRKGQIWERNKTGYRYTLIAHCFGWWYLQMGGGPDAAPFGLRREAILKGFTRVGRERKKPIFYSCSTNGDYSETYADGKVRRPFWAKGLSSVRPPGSASHSPRCRSAG